VALVESLRDEDYRDYSFNVACMEPVYEGWGDGGGGACE
jgi:hypothetical protein